MDEGRDEKGEGGGEAREWDEGEEEREVKKVAYFQRIKYGESRGD